jgi:hypothetical protein
MRLLALLLIFGCSHKLKSDGKITLIKQWHASPSTVTTDVTASRDLPQYKNQREIYDYLVSEIESKGEITLLVEGCQAEVPVEFGFTAVNGWSYELLKGYSSRRDYADVITALPLKLKAKYPHQVKAICADDLNLITAHQRALSDAKGNLGFYIRLTEVKPGTTMFQRYHQALEEAHRIKTSNPVEAALKQGRQDLTNFRKYLSERNAIFLKLLVKFRHENPILIVGGLHTEELMEELTLAQIETTLIIPDDYPSESERILFDLEKSLEQLPSPAGN